MRRQRPGSWAHLLDRSVETARRDPADSIRVAGLLMRRNDPIRAVRLLRSLEPDRARILTPRDLAGAVAWLIAAGDRTRGERLLDDVLARQANDGARVSLIALTVMLFLKEGAPEDKAPVVRTLIGRAGRLAPREPRLAGALKRVQDSGYQGASAASASALGTLRQHLEESLTAWQVRARGSASAIRALRRAIVPPITGSACVAAPARTAGDDRWRRELLLEGLARLAGLHLGLDAVGSPAGA
jgi:hypothetical protein